MVNSAGAVRKSAEERREQILGAAVEEFAAKGLRGASVEDIARDLDTGSRVAFAALSALGAVMAYRLACARQQARGRGVD